MRRSQDLPTRRLVGLALVVFIASTAGPAAAAPLPELHTVGNGADFFSAQPSRADASGIDVSLTRQQGQAAGKFLYRCLDSSGQIIDEGSLEPGPMAPLEPITTTARCDGTLTTRFEIFIYISPRMCHMAYERDQHPRLSQDEYTSQEACEECDGMTAEVEGNTRCRDPEATGAVLPWPAAVGPPQPPSPPPPPAPSKPKTNAAASTHLEFHKDDDDLTPRSQAVCSLRIPGRVRVYDGRTFFFINPVVQIAQDRFLISFGRWRKLAKELEACDQHALVNHLRQWRSWRTVGNLIVTIPITMFAAGHHKNQFLRGLGQIDGNGKVEWK